MHKSASNGGEEVFFFEVDGMDQSKTKLPHFQYKMPKDVDPDHLLHVHLTCVRYDGTRADDIYYYTNTLPHDSANIHDPPRSSGKPSLRYATIFGLA